MTEGAEWIQTSRQLWYGHMSGCWFFTFFGTVQIIYTYIRYFRCIRSRRGSYYMPNSSLVINCRGRRIPIEGWIKLSAFAFLTVFTAFFTSKGPFKQDAMSTFHVPLTILAAVAGVVDVLVVHKIAPKRMDYLFWAAMHLLSGYLVANHHYPEFGSTGHNHGGAMVTPMPCHNDTHDHHMEKRHAHGEEMEMTTASAILSTTAVQHTVGHHFTPLEGALHNMFALILYSGFIFLILELYAKCRSVLFTLCRGTANLLMGLWLGVAAHYLYPADQNNPPLDFYSVESVIVCTGLFAWTIVAGMCFTPIVGFVMQRCMAPDLNSLLRRRRDARNGADSDDDSSDYEMLVPNSKAEEAKLEA